MDEPNKPKPLDYDKPRAKASGVPPPLIIMVGAFGACAAYLGLSAVPKAFTQPSTTTGTDLIFCGAFVCVGAAALFLAIHWLRADWRADRSEPDE